MAEFCGCLQVHVQPWTPVMPFAAALGQNDGSFGFLESKLEARGERSLRTVFFAGN